MLSCDSQQADSNEPDESSDDDDSTLRRSTALPSTNFDTDSPPMGSLPTMTSVVNFVLGQEE